MRIPLTAHGIRELLLFGGGSLAISIALVPIALWASPVFFLLFLFVLSFFRDPERSSDSGPDTAVSPADGKVTDIEEVDEPYFLNGKALRIGIFLSVFNVHVNRAPLRGKVTGVRYLPGKFLDARDPRCIVQNEANLVGFSGDHGPFAVRQISGLIARKIICPLAEGEELERGGRMGMIKFGSRTELLVPADADVEVLVKIGDNVRGGATQLLRYRSER